MSGISTAIVVASVVRGRVVVVVVVVVVGTVVGASVVEVVVVVGCVVGGCDVISWVVISSVLVADDVVCVVSAMFGDSVVFTLSTFNTSSSCDVVVSRCLVSVEFSGVSLSTGAAVLNCEDKS